MNSKKRPRGHEEEEAMDTKSGEKQGGGCRKEEQPEKKA